MESELIKNEPIPELPYPKLMINKKYGYIVFFVKHGEGQVVFKNKKSGHDLGYISPSWARSNFDDLPREHKVVLRN